MKLIDLGLKQKPQTKYVEGGYASFSTILTVLFVEVHQVTKQSNSIVYESTIKSKKHLEKIMESKTIEDLLLVEVQA